MSAGERELPRQVPAIAAALVVLLFDPWWLDFEAARRSMLLVLCGTGLLLGARWFTQRARGERWLWLLLGWGALAALTRASTVIWSDAVLRWSFWLALALLCRLGTASGAAPWQRLAAWLLPVIAVVGILQRLDVMTLGGSIDEPVSLFGNRNVAAEFVAVSGAAVAAGWTHHRRLGAVALLLGATYAIMNGSRSALLALPIALAFVAVTGSGRSRRDRLWPLGAALLGAALGLLLQLVGGNSTARAPANDLRVATIEVRLEIARSGLSMLADAPLFGHGPGQFAVQYPRYRSQREIEISSLGRTEQRRVATAHDDWLELPIEAGVPALLLLLGYALVRWRSAQQRVDLAPLIALGVLMFVRAPMGNAPAVALALLASAGAAATALPPAGPRRVLLRLLGVALLLLGLATASASTLVGRHLSTRAVAPTGDRTWLERATAIWPCDPTTWQLLAQEREFLARSATDAEAALAAAERAVALRPFEPSYRLLRADLLRLCNRLDDAKRELAEVARLDPGEPQVNVQLAGVFFTEHDVDGTVAALLADPPPILRKDLAARFDEFADLAQRAGNAVGARRFLAEASCVRALDATGKSDARARAIAGERFETMRLAFQSAGLHDGDLREFVVLALRALDTGDTVTAAGAATAARAGNRQLQAWQWPLLRPFAERLRAIAAWRELLPDA